MNNQDLKEEIYHLFNRKWDEELTDEQEDELQNIFDKLIKTQGWEQVFNAIDEYMRNHCTTSQSTVNFANLFWGYTCANPQKISEPYRFLGYLYHKIDLKPWDYDCAEVYEGLVYNMLSGKNEYNHNPFLNYDYVPEKDPDIVAEVEKLRKEENS